MRTGTATLPLHGGKAPAWLFSRMRLLAREITLAIVSEFGPGEMLVRLSDPAWFQAFGAVLGFDWHSSGVTTTVCGALKDGLRGLEHESGLVIAGGKGGVSRKTPGEIEAASAAGTLRVAPDRLVYASKMAAKVDSAGLQDGYQIYHHSFFCTRDGSWAVVQQGMHDANGMARRYHWLSDSVTDFVVEPHQAIASQAPGVDVLNLVAKTSAPAQLTITELSHEPPDRVAAQLDRLKNSIQNEGPPDAHRGRGRDERVRGKDAGSVRNGATGATEDDASCRSVRARRPLLHSESSHKCLSMPRRHAVELSDIHPENLKKAFVSTYERQAEDFETLLGLPGVGPKTVRALALIAELVYDTPASRSDPALFSYAHGGKDGFPYPVDRPTYDRNIEILGTAVAQAKVGRSERLDALKRLAAVSRRAEATRAGRPPV